MKYNLASYSGHMVISLAEGRFVIDTGSPTSFSRSGRLSFCDMMEKVSTSAMGMLDADKLSSYIGASVDGLVGMDVLAKYRLTFFAVNTLFADQSNMHDNQISPIQDASFLSLTTEMFMGIPVVSINVNKKAVRMFVDSGAKVSYLDTRRLADFPVEVTLQDFYPGVGEFNVDVSTVWCDLNGWPFPARFGRLPALLQMTLMLGGVDGIIGRDLFESYTIRVERGGSPVLFLPHI